MTQKEIDNFLANTKVYVNGKSREIQEKLFSLGYSWSDGIGVVCHTNEPFLYIWGDKTFCRGHLMDSFMDSPKKEITAEQILALELTEPSYRPFKDAEECWQEMLKHEPFGWIIHDDCYIHIHETGYGEISCLHNEGAWNLELKDTIDHIKFADGTPFGIKEE